MTTVNWIEWEVCNIRNLCPMEEIYFRRFGRHIFASNTQITGLASRFTWHNTRHVFFLNQYEMCVIGTLSRTSVTVFAICYVGLVLYALGINNTTHVLWLYLIARIPKKDSNPCICVIVFFVWISFFSFDSDLCYEFLSYWIMNENHYDNYLIVDLCKMTEIFLLTIWL